MSEMNFNEWKKDKFIDHKTRGVDMWDSGYNCGLEAGLLEAKDLHSENQALRKIVDELTSALQTRACDYVPKSYGYVDDAYNVKHLDFCQKCKALAHAKSELEKLDANDPALDQNSAKSNELKNDSDVDQGNTR